MDEIRRDAPKITVSASRHPRTEGAVTIGTQLLICLDQVFATIMFAMAGGAPTRVQQGQIEMRGIRVCGNVVVAVEAGLALYLHKRLLMAGLAIVTKMLMRCADFTAEPDVVGQV